MNALTHPSTASKHKTQSAMPPLRTMQSARLHTLLVLSLWMAAVSSFRGRLKRLTLKSIRLSHSSLSRHEASCIDWIVPRGGSTEEQDGLDESDLEEETNSDLDEDESSDQDEESDVDESEKDDENPLSSVISSEPLTINVKTNLGNKVVDQTMELLVSRTRDVASVKQTLSRQLPGRPPASTLTLMIGSRVLGDEELVDELVDDEDEHDEEEKSGTLVLTLDMVPPVDPKFATTLELDDMTTSDILDAYTANAAAMYNNAQSLVSEPSADKAFGSLSIQLRHEAYRIRDQLTSAFPESALSKLKEDTPPHETQEVAQRRGQRYRSGRGGAKTNMKRTIQRNLNVNWPDTIRNFLLFIFFGLFGGRNSVSRNLLLLGAPLCFVLQARPVKIMLKQAFYAMSNPPGIFLSLLPAPQQAILSFNEDDAREELYGVGKVKVNVHASDDENIGSGDEDGYNEDEYDSGDESDY